MKPKSRWGSIRKTKTGLFQARYTAPDGKRYRAPESFSSEENAVAFLDRVKVSIDLGIWEPPVPVSKVELSTVEDLILRWLEESESRVKLGQLQQTSLQVYKNIAEHRILNDRELAKTKITDLTPVIVADWWGRIIRRYPETLNRNKRAYYKLKGVLDSAVETGIIDHNPASSINTRRSGTLSPKKKKLATTKDFHKILSFIDDRYKLATVLCLFHGLRIGEALALKIADFVDTESGGLEVKVHATAQRISKDGKTRMVYSPVPKTEAGIRTVPILPEFTKMVRGLLRKRDSSPDSYATVSNSGGLLFDTAFRLAFNRARDSAGVDPEITPHYGRNWLITRLAEAGATPKEIGAILGQDDVSTIVNTYMKVRQKRPTELMDNLDTTDD